MKLKNIIGVVLAVALFTSCNKYLDVDPKGIVIPKKFNEFDQILNSETNTNLYPIPFVYASDDVFADLSTSVVSPFTNTYFWRQIIDINNNDESAIWGPFYRQIYNTNIIINNILTVTDASEAKKQHLLGEALVERAYAHFNVLTAFTKAYNPSTASELPGIPYVTYTDVTNKTPGRSTLQATLDLIIADLKKAEDLLTANRQSKLRVNKTVAQAILSRVYLYMGDYAQAMKYADLVLGSPHEILDYNYYEYPYLMDNPEYLFVQSTTDPDMTMGLFFYSKSLYDLYNPDDLRTMFFSYSEGGAVYYFGDFMYGIRFSEFLLTKMEILARNNNVAEALNMLNDFRQLRIADYAYEPLESTDQAEVLKWILDERRCELAFGSTRWIDMKRLAANGLGEISTRYTVDGKELVSIDPSTYSYTFEIPSRVLLFNPDMQKNF